MGIKTYGIDFSEDASDQAKTAVLQRVINDEESSFLLHFNLSGLTDDDVSPDVVARFGVHFAIKTYDEKYGNKAWRDPQLVGGKFEFFAAFYSTLGGERFFSLPVQCLSGVVIYEPEPELKERSKNGPFKVIRGGR